MAAAAATALGLLLLLLLLLGLGGGPGAVLLAVAAGAGGAWAAQAGKDRKGAPAAGASVANGGPAMRCRLEEQQDEERRRRGRRRPEGPCGDYLSPSAHFVVAPRRRYPIHQAQYTSLGTLPSICWDGYRRKTRLSLHNSSIVQSPVTVKIARPGSHICRSPFLEKLESPVAFSLTPGATVDPCAKETVLSALKENRKRAVLDGEEEEEEDCGFPRGQESKRRRHDSGGSGQSAFEPLVANGAPASLVPKPGSLKRSLAPPHCLEDSSAKRSRTSSLSSMNSPSAGGIPSSLRNAIASSYSSTCGLSQLWKRRGPGSSPLSSPESSRSQTPERPSKKSRFPSSSLADEVAFQSSQTTPTRLEKEARSEKIAETPVQKRAKSLGLASSGSSSAKRKRKIQLLSNRRSDNFVLPPPPQLGYLVTSADLDAEKAAALQWFNKVLEEKTDSALSSAVPAASVPSALSFTTNSGKATVVSESVPAAGSNPLLDSLKKMKEGQSGSTQADAGAAPDSSLLPTADASASLDLGSPVPEAPVETAKPPTLPSSPPVAMAGDAPPSSPLQPAGSPCSLAASALSQTPARPSSAPKPSILFGILSTPPASQSPARAAATSSPVSEAAPLFKPIFGGLAKGGSSPPAAGGTSTSAASLVPPRTVPAVAAAAPSGSTFRPIFGPLPGPATTVSSPFSFKPTLQQDPSSSVLGPSSTTAGSSGFSAPSESTSTTPALLSTVATATSAAASKPMFSFGPPVTASTGGPSSTSAAAAAAVTTTPVSQTSLFGIPPNANPAVPSLFQFGKMAATTGSSGTTSSFSQAGASSVAEPAVPTTTAPSVFSGSNITQAPAATTQSVLAFGSGPSIFSPGFGSASKPPPPYAATGGSQPALETGDGQQTGSKPATAGPVAFGTPFSFSGSVAQPAAQAAFGGTTQTPFGGTGAPSTFGAKSASQPTFGATTSVFFGKGTSSISLGSAAGTSVFGSPAPSPFAFGSANQPPASSSTFAIGVAPGAAVGAGAPATGFSFGSGQSSGPAGTTAPFGSSLSQNQSPAFAFSISGTPESKPTFGGAPAPTFGQSSPAPAGSSVAGSALSFGSPAFGGAGPFGPSGAAFSIGSGAKTTRQRLQARRQHTRKK